MRVSRIVVLAVVAAPAAALLIERLVVTDPEAIGVRIVAATAAVANRDFEALRDALDEEYAADGREGGHARPIGGGRGPFQQGPEDLDPA